ncbi:MAG: 2Fe-2S iron-sulfur cluster binding domain-containing protein [Candidatus Dormibacteraeota bacterium]|nr:2Fe-2S iron-sulfur cluster binding domain-containing protein [Candidatus Dormibacteraeota bacterium]
MAQIKVLPFDRIFPCGDDNSILAAALTHGHFLRYGCKHGGCGTCKVVLIDGDVEEGGSSFALASAERSQGWILACSSRPLSDCVIDISAMALTEAEFLAGDQAETLQTALEHKELLTPTIFGLTLRLVDPPSMRFLAGQFVNVEVPGVDGPRAFSMANAPSADSEIELIVKRLPGGKFAEYLETSARLGDTIRVRGPVGSLRVRPSYRKIIMIAGGSGMAPMLSMLSDLGEKGDRRSVTFFFGARTCDELYYLERLDRLCGMSSSLEFVPVVERAEAGWAGEEGLVTQVVERRMGSLKGYDAYLCGPPPMVEAARESVVRLGVREANIHYDAFVPTGAATIGAVVG